MTKQEHELMVLMFARVFEAIGRIEETFKSRGIWTDDDAKAFAHAVHTDARNLVEYTSRAMLTYLHLAKQSGVETGLES
jgi:hypothetical protein